MHLGGWITTLYLWIYPGEEHPSTEGEGNPGAKDSGEECEEM